MTDSNIWKKTNYIQQSLTDIFGHNCVHKEQFWSRIMIISGRKEQLLPSLLQLPLSLFMPIIYLFIYLFIWNYTHSIVHVFFFFVALSLYMSCLFLNFKY